jgi:hypothetical protein
MQCHRDAAIVASTSPTPENARVLALRAVETVHEVDGALLDYSPESLKDIDRIVLGFRSRNLTFSDVGETLFLFDCYVGEVLVKPLGAKWVMPDEKLAKLGFKMIGVQTPQGAFLNPIGEVIKLLENGSEDSVAYFYAVASKTDSR